MRRLLVMQDAVMAQTLVDYLRLRKIVCRLSMSEYGVEIILDDDSQQQQADNEIRLFMSDPNHPRYRNASWQVGQSSLKLPASDFSSLWHSYLLHAGPVTLGITVIAVMIYLSGFIGYEEPLFEALSFHSQIEALWNWQIWRYFTPALFHFSLIHLVFNMLWWWYFGGMIERHKGSWRLILLLVIGAAISNLAQFLVSGPFFGGLSGVVYALLGYVWLSHWLDRDSLFQFPKGIVILMLLWLGLGFLDLFPPKMANMAHLVGLLVGCFQAIIESRFYRRKI